MYVLVRNDLGPIYRMVQGMHAVANRMKTPYPNHRTIVCLGVKSENELIQWIAKLESKGIAVSYFREPDLNDEHTALAVVTDRSRIFNSLQVTDWH